MSNATPLPIVTTGRGKYKAGIRGTAIHSGDRTVFLGESCARVVLPEFTLELACGDQKWTQEHATYDRDFVFAT
jgi:hypothetical protein